MQRMTKLDEIALNIELVLISIIEGVALTNLAEVSEPVMHNTAAWPYIPFVLAGLAILLVFWSQAILHAISFIRWPLRMEHMLLYFVAVFIQIVAYNTMSDLAGWFFWWSLFSLLTMVIYGIDLRVIRDMRIHFSGKKGGTEFISEIERRHLTEMKYLVPIAVAFNIIACALAAFDPSLFSSPYAYAGIGALQLIITLGALVDCVRNFRSRSRMIPALHE